MTGTTIQASPTKEFFIRMLTRDVLLTRAIIDLVDNSVDGAKRLRPDGDFNGLHVIINFSAEDFRIEDNCGGITIATARDYAFRFGRPKNAPATTSSVGQFGVGMKRTFFKLGRFFRVESSTATSRFEMEVDVEEWLNQGGDTGSWHFDFKTIEEGIVIPPEDVGTKIVVNRLRDEPKQSFQLHGFLRSLQQGLSEGHALVLAQGMEMSVNGVHLSHHPLELLQSSEIVPAYIEKIYYESDPNPVHVRLYCGISSRQKDEGGWYVFCNGRMVLRADQGIMTGWGEDEGNSTPRYHPDYAFFRGYVFFDCEDASNLPWTTTKTGVDADTWLYRTVREDMIQISKPVLKFLRELRSERADVSSGDRPSSALEKVIQRTAPCAITQLGAAPVFVAPRIQPVSGPRMQKIQYSKPLEEVNAVKLQLGAKNFTEVGIQTFEYYQQYEVQS